MISVEHGEKATPPPTENYTIQNLGDMSQSTTTEEDLATMLVTPYCNGLLMMDPQSLQRPFRLIEHRKVVVMEDAELHLMSVVEVVS